MRTRNILSKLVRWLIPILVLCRQPVIAQELPRIMSITGSTIVGPAGPPGAQGPPGPAGSAIAYGTYSGTQASNTVWTIAGTTHTRGTCAVTIQIWVPTASSHGNVSCNQTTFDITITFPVAVAGSIIITSDPVFLQPFLAPSLVTTIVPQVITTPTTTITHNLNGVVLVRCTTGSGQPIGFNTATPTTSNVVTITFIGPATGVCVAAR